MPESESTETILDEEDEEDEDHHPPTLSVEVSTSSIRQNGIESGITLKATALKEDSGGACGGSRGGGPSASSRRPGPYANVGKKRTAAGKASDEEIRC
jgi:hypothetical protein